MDEDDEFNNQLLTLAQAAQLIPGAKVGTLLRRAREGKLVVYRPGKAYLTTRANLRRMLELCKLEVGRLPVPLPVQTQPIRNELGLTDVQLANISLDHARQRIRRRHEREKAERRRQREEEWERTRPERERRAKERRSARAKARYQEQKRTRLKGEDPSST